MSCRRSQSAAKRVASDSDRGSASIRRVCASSTFGSDSLPSAASAMSSASGGPAQRKNARRDANATSETR